MTDRSCEILVVSRIVRGTTPRPVSDKLAESMTREERRQILKEVVSELGFEKWARSQVVQSTNVDECQHICFICRGEDRGR
eukprot:3278838-Amphidinium_carterae.1